MADGYHTREALTKIMALIERKVWLNKSDDAVIAEIKSHIKAIPADTKKGKK